MPLPDQDIKLIYADDAIAVIEKPPEMLSVPGRGPDKQDCAQRRLQALFPTVLVAHRLDWSTSGLLVYGLTAAAHRELSRQFHDREVEKEYIACVQGEMHEDSGEVNLPLMVDWPNRPRQMVSEEGRPALTRYRRLAIEQGNTRVSLVPITGRSHQLRVHMMSIGHPILGDDLYGDPACVAAAERLLLHAARLGFKHPVSAAPLMFESPAPF